MLLKMGKYLKKMKKNESGFTLIELMVVIVILGILAVLVLPRIVGTVTGDARRNAHSANIHMLQSAADRYAADTGNNLPTGTAGLNNLTTNPSPGSTSWKGPYVSGIPSPPPNLGVTAYTVYADNEIGAN